MNLTHGNKSKIQFEQDSATTRQDELKDEITVMQYWLNIGEQKIQAILGRYKQKMHQKIIESLENGWKIWSTQAP